MSRVAVGVLRDAAKVVVTGKSGHTMLLVGEACPSIPTLLVFPIVENYAAVAAADVQFTSLNGKATQRYFLTVN